MSFEQPVTDPVTPTNTTDQLTFIVGERTFDAAQAVTKIENADAHIATLEAENAALKAKDAQSTSIDEALSQLREQNATPQNVQPTIDTPTVSEEQIGAIASKQIADYLAAQQVTNNAQAAEDLATRTYQETGEALKVIYGDKTDEAMAQKAEALGMSKNDLYNMAKSPSTAAMLKQIMTPTSAPNQASPSNGFTTAHHVAPTEQLVDHSKSYTSSSILDSIKNHGAGYN
jgi:hypothetical protein